MTSFSLFFSPPAFLASTRALTEPRHQPRWRIIAFSDERGSFLSLIRPVWIKRRSQEPDRTYPNLRGFKSVDRLLLRSLETSIYGIWGSKLVKWPIGRERERRGRCERHVPNLLIAAAWEREKVMNFYFAYACRGPSQHFEHANSASRTFFFDCPCNFPSPPGEQKKRPTTHLSSKGPDFIGQHTAT